MIKNETAELISKLTIQVDKIVSNEAKSNAAEAFRYSRFRLVIVLILVILSLHAFLLVRLMEWWAQISSPNMSSVVGFDISLISLLASLVLCLYVCAQKNVDC